MMIQSWFFPDIVKMYSSTDIVEAVDQVEIKHRANPNQHGPSSKLSFYKKPSLVSRFIIVSIYLTLVNLTPNTIPGPSESYPANYHQEH